MTGIQALKARLDNLSPPVKNNWLRHTGAYHRIFEESESEQRAYSRMLFNICANEQGVTIPDDTMEELITEQLSTERLRGTKWEQFVTDWSNLPWAQQRRVVFA